MASFLQVSLPKPSIHIASPTYVLHASPIPSFLMLIPPIIPGEQYRSLSFSLRSLFSPCHLDHFRFKYPPHTLFSNTPAYVLLPLQHTKYHTPIQLQSPVNFCKFLSSQFLTPKDNAKHSVPHGSRQSAVQHVLNLFVNAI